jgi:bacteriorhodopsin
MRGAPLSLQACIAASAFAGVLVLTSLTLSVTYHEVPLFLRDFVSLLRYALLLTWLAYPVIWALGPEGEYSDLFPEKLCKTIFTIVSVHDKFRFDFS